MLALSPLASPSCESRCHTEFDYEIHTSIYDENGRSSSRISSVTSEGRANIVRGEYALQTDCSRRQLDNYLIAAARLGNHHSFECSPSNPVCVYCTPRSLALSFVNESLYYFFVSRSPQPSPSPCVFDRPRRCMMITLITLAPRVMCITGRPGRVGSRTE
jgi:hypothetical protein